MGWYPHLSHTLNPAHDVRNIQLIRIVCENKQKTDTYPIYFKVTCYLKIDTCGPSRDFSCTPKSPKVSNTTLNIHLQRAQRARKQNKSRICWSIGHNQPWCRSPRSILQTSFAAYRCVHNKTSCIYTELHYQDVLHSVFKNTHQVFTACLMPCPRQ
jgi:hypothetical protein